jgi:hypothetical protein
VLVMSSTGTAEHRDSTPIQDLRLASGAKQWMVDGEADGAHDDLQSIPGHNAFWFAWSAFHPNTRVWGGSRTKQPKPAPSTDDTCTIPCGEIVAGCPRRDCIRAGSRNIPKSWRRICDGVNNTDGLLSGWCARAT